MIKRWTIFQDHDFKENLAFKTNLKAFKMLQKYNDFKFNCGTRPCERLSEEQYESFGPSTGVTLSDRDLYKVLLSIWTSIVLSESKSLTQQSRWFPIFLSWDPHRPTNLFHAPKNNVTDFCEAAGYLCLQCRVFVHSAEQLRRTGRCSCIQRGLLIPSSLESLLFPISPLIPILDAARCKSLNIIEFSE